MEAAPGDRAAYCRRHRRQRIKAPRDGRVQYRVAEPGGVIGWRRVLNMVDLSDVI